jgi:predicted enzyme related to lactoylglutathione lyase
MQAYPHGIVSLVIDCSELDRAAAFWCEVLGYRPMGQSDGKYLSLVPDGDEGIELLLQRVADRKTAENRVHLDLRTDNLPVELERVVQAGATKVTTEPLREGGWIWHICADPDGNEFCILQPPGLFRTKP